MVQVGRMQGEVLKPAYLYDVSPIYEGVFADLEYSTQGVNGRLAPLNSQRW